MWSHKQSIKNYILARQVKQFESLMWPIYYSFVKFRTVANHVFEKDIIPMYYTDIVYENKFHNNMNYHISM
jgi:hypothetical protein